MGCGGDAHLAFFVAFAGAEDAVLIAFQFNDIGALAFAQVAVVAGLVDGLELASPIAPDLAGAEEDGDEDDGEDQEPEEEDAHCSEA